MGELEDARREIDEIDREMAELFEARMRAVQAVALYKAQTGTAITDTGREAEVLRRAGGYLQDAALGQYYDDFLRQVMRLSREYQAQILGRGSVAYQGAEGGFGYLAAGKLFPHAQKLAKATFADVFDAVEAGEAAFGVVPFENSATGDVSGVLDLCYAHSCHVTAMFDLPVKQNLLGLAGAALGDIKTVYSHEQALEQSKRFLSALRVRLVPSENTAVAAKYVAEAGDKTLAAVGSEEAGAMYGLVPLAEDISNTAGNATRFIVISKYPALSGDRFSLLVTVENGVGRLAKIIGIIAQEGFDMENIKSRPLPQRPWEYYFYMELVGEAHGEAAQKLLAKMEKASLSVRLLGVYGR